MIIQRIYIEKNTLALVHVVDVISYLHRAAVPSHGVGESFQPATRLCVNAIMYSQSKERNERKTRGGKTTNTIQNNKYNII